MPISANFPKLQNWNHSQKYYRDPKAIRTMRRSIKKKFTFQKHISVFTPVGAPAAQSEPKIVQLDWEIIGLPEIQLPIR